MTDQFWQIRRILEEAERQMPSYAIRERLETAEALRQAVSDTSLFGDFSDAHDFTSVNSSLIDTISRSQLPDQSALGDFTAHEGIRQSLASQHTTGLLAESELDWLTFTSLSSQIRLLKLDYRTFGSGIEASDFLSQDLS